MATHELPKKKKFPPDGVPLVEAPKNRIIPLEIANAIIEKYDSTLGILDEHTQIYGKAIDGRGTVEYKNGNRYEGQFENGMLHGEGAFYWANAIKYTGMFQQNQITGIGHYEWPDGSWYKGHVKNGLRHGRGEYATPGEDCIYDGDWCEGLKQGKGKMTFKSGTVYEGDFERGLKHGQGKIVYPSGNYYEGSWVFDKKEGEGTMYWSNTNEKYSGSWVDNKQEGWGSHMWLEQKGEGKFLRNRYEGEWRMGLRNGIGVFYYSNGSKYEGEWVDNLKEGFAIFTYEDGRTFKGFYKNDKMVPNAPKDTILGDASFNTLNNINNNLQNANSGGDSPSRKRQETKNSDKRTPNKQPQPASLASSEKGEQKESVPKVTEVIQGNPYDAMLDINDLFIEEDEEATLNEIRGVKNLMLRYHAELKTWYRIYIGKQQSNPEEAFALTSKMFWKMLRDARILSPRATLAAFNRLFIRGGKNSFELHATQQSLRADLYVAKREYLESLTEFERETKEFTIESIPEEELYSTDRKVDVHDENRVLLFRHFADAFVRVAYLKFGGPPEFAKKVEKVLVRIKSSLENRKKPKSQVEEENILIRIRPFMEPFKDRLKQIFQRMPSKAQALSFDTFDYAVMVKKIVEVFEKCGIIKEEGDLELVLHNVERTYDPNECYVPVETGSKDKNASQVDFAEKMQRLMDLLGSEVLFLEFFDIFLLSLFKKDGSNVKEEEAKRRIGNNLKALEDYLKESDADIKDALEAEPAIKWPYSDKDYMFEHLTVEKEKRERELALLKQRRLEREVEEKEAKAMEKEDFDIGDQFMRPVTKQTTESGEYTESYNEF